MDNISVSIIIPVYKTPAHLLHRFLESALKQTLTNIQLIAVDDASPDQCPEILDQTAAHDERMAVVHRSTNGRAGMARSDGMALAKGRYVLFADADDVLQPDMCETLVNLALQYDADIIACSWDICDPTGRVIGVHHFPDRRYDLKSPRQRAAAYRRMNYALWNKLFRRETIASLRFEQFEANIGEDTLFNVAALCRSRKMVLTSYRGYGYTVHTASATGQSAKAMPYLRTLVKSSDRIRETLIEGDASTVGKKFMDLLTLKRFTTGCRWIADNPDPQERAVMWEYWRHYLYKILLPSITSYKILATWYKIIGRRSDASSMHRLTWFANRISDPLSIVDKLNARGLLVK